MANKSVEAFRKLTLDMQRQVYIDAITELPAQAAKLVALMKLVCPRRTGRLAGTIHWEAGSKPTVVRVMAGGAATTTTFRRNARYEREVKIGSGDTAGIAKVSSGGFGVTYDYARAVEFGAKGYPPHPFFFPTFRLTRNKMRRVMKSKITKTIKRYSAE